MPLATMTKERPKDVHGPPKGIRFLQEAPGMNRRAYVLESPPQWLRVRYRGQTDYGRPIRNMRYRIRVPWMYLIGTGGSFLDKAFLCFAKARAETPMVRVYQPPMPNIFPTGHLCLSRYSGGRSLREDVAGRLKDVLQYFMTSGFNFEIWPGVRSLPEGWRKPTRAFFYTVFQEWQARSKRIERVEWRHPVNQNGHKIKTLKGAITHALNC